MNNIERIWALIPAAGVGRRFGGPTPKQYLELGGRRIIDHVLALFLAHPAISGCVVALDPQDPYWPSGAFANDPRVRRAPGGAERCHSVRNALAVLAQEAAAEDWVLVHDAARPCLRKEDLDALLAALVDEPVGALLAVPVHDTVKQAQSAASERIERTVPRADLWRAYTPQAFRLGMLHQALEVARAANALVTDDAAALELQGLAPRLIAGHADNIKITQPEDLALAEFYLIQQGRLPC